MYEAVVIKDSQSQNGEHRLTTMVVTHPWYIHPQFLTHRYFSRNASSSRAIPIDKMIGAVEKDPFIPHYWGRNQSGMQSAGELDEMSAGNCKGHWMVALRHSLKMARILKNEGLHKEMANRVLLPYSWMTVVVTGNQSAWNNYFHLRCDSHADPHIQKGAYMAREAMDRSYPTVLLPGQYHLPFIDCFNKEDYSLSEEQAIRVSVGRCARVSYKTHEGIRDTSKDIELHDRLMTDGHWSPFEHVAKLEDASDPCAGKLGGNFGLPWVQYRKLFQKECVNVREV